MKSNKQRILDELKHQADKQGFEFSNYNRIDRNSTDDHRVGAAHMAVEEKSPTTYGAIFQAQALGVSTSLIYDRIKRTRVRNRNNRKH